MNLFNSIISTMMGIQLVDLKELTAKKLLKYYNISLISIRANPKFRTLVIEMRTHIFI